MTVFSLNGKTSMTVFPGPHPHLSKLRKRGGSEESYVRQRSICKYICSGNARMHVRIKWELKYMTCTIR